MFRSGIRTALCALSICIGVASVTTITGIGGFAAKAIEQEIDQIGLSDLAFYQKENQPVSEAAVRAVAQADGIEAAMPLTLASGTVRLRNLRSNAGILGADSALEAVFRLQLLHGSLLSKAGEKTAIIEDTLAQRAYRRTNVVGKQLLVTVNGVTEHFTVSAVIRSQSTGLSAMLGSSLPYLVYVPADALEAMGGGAADKIAAAVSPGETDLDALAQSVSRSLERTFGEAYRYENLNQYLATFSNITGIVTRLVGGIAAISIVVGGIGVMNTMVSAVEARVREVGIYRALGASKTDIVRCFLAESLVICLMGGIAGVGLSRLIFELLRQTLQMNLVYDWVQTLAGLGIAAGCGVLFGILPALQAAKLDPIRAIRSE